MRLLIIADQSQANLLLPVLCGDCIQVDVADSLEKADIRLKTHNSYEAVLFKHEQPQTVDIAVLQRWRREGVHAFIMVLLPRNSSACERASCLDAGADACLSQPVSSEELLAHLRALRRREQPKMSTVQRVHDLEINTAIRSVTRGGKSIHLTPREFDLLHLLASYRGKVLTRSIILDHLYDDRDGSGSNVIDVYIRYLRTKIDKGFDKPLILTCWGQGYQLRPEGA